VAIEPGAGLLHGVAVLDAVDGGGQFGFPSLTPLSPSYIEPPRRNVLVPFQAVDQYKFAHGPATPFSAIAPPSACHRRPEQRAIARPAAKAGGAVEGNVERDQVHAGDSLAGAANQLLRPATDQQQRDMQAFARDQLAAKPVRQLENARNPVDFRRSGKIRNSGKNRRPQSPKPRSITPQLNTPEHIMNITQCQGIVVPRKAKCPAPFRIWHRLAQHGCRG
jgi:hypothetical protein